MAQDKSSNKMDSDALKPVPARRKIQSNCDIQSGITYRKPNKGVSQSKSETEVEMAKMNDEIMQYRMNLHDIPKTDSKDIKNGTDSQDIHNLKQQLQDVLEKNSQWQVYDNQREEHVRGLHQKYNELHYQYHQLQEKISQNTTQSAEQQRNDDVLAQTRKESAKIKHENAKLKTLNDEMRGNFENEISKLKKDVEYWRRKYDNKNEILLRFREQYDAECHKNKASNANKENRNRIDMLKREMDISRKDFQMERKRREDIERQLNNLQNRMKDTEMTSDRRHEHLYEYGCDEDEKKHIHGRSSHAYKHSPPKMKKVNPIVDVTSRSHKDRKSYPTEHIHGSGRTKKSQIDKNRKVVERPAHLSRTNHKLNQTYSEYGHFNDPELQCPNCGKVYGVEEHEFLLVHIDSCV